MRRALGTDSEEIHTAAETPTASQNSVVADAATSLLEAGGLTSLTTVLWLAVGVSATWWISQLTFPSPRRVRIR